LVILGVVEETREGGESWRSLGIVIVVHLVQQSLRIHQELIRADDRVVGGGCSGVTAYRRSAGNLRHEVGASHVLYAETRWERIQFSRASGLLGPQGEKQGRVMVSVGHPAVINLERYADAQNMRINQEMRRRLKTRQYFLVRFALLIAPTTTVRVTGLDVDIRLRSQDDRAVVWSLDPIAVEEEIEVMVASKVRDDFRLAPRPVDFENPTNEESTTRFPILHAYGLGESANRGDGSVAAGWVMRPIEGALLSGITVLAMVVDAPRSVGCDGEVVVKAQLTGSVAPRHSIVRKTYSLGTGTKRIAFRVAP
jgi:hypothetical protein